MGYGWVGSCTDMGVMYVCMCIVCGWSMWGRMWVNCVCVCRGCTRSMCEYMHVILYVLNVCMSMCARVCMCVHVCPCVHVHVCVCVHLCECVYVSVSVSVCLCQCVT